MIIPAAIASFIQGPVLTTLGTRDARNRPMIARGSGGHSLVAPGRLEIAISASLWPETVANLRDNGALSVTFVDPESYRAFQVKGRGALREADADDCARAVAYVAQLRQRLVGFGIEGSAIDFWLTARDIVMATLDVDRVFEQTPGSRAGTVVT